MILNFWIFFVNESSQFVLCCTDVPVDIEHADEGVLLNTGDQSLIDVLHNPVEELGVDMFGQGVSSVGGLNAGKGLDVRL